jgi:uncharacterized protein
MSNFDLSSYLRTKPVIALVGASINPEKYGHIIWQDMEAKGFTIIPINRRGNSLGGRKSYETLRAAKDEHDIGLVVYVVPPERTLESLKEAESLGLKKVWIQPGAGNSDVRQFLESNSFDYLLNACVMVQS